MNLFHTPASLLTQCRDLDGELDVLDDDGGESRLLCVPAALERGVRS